MKIANHFGRNSKENIGIIYYSNKLFLLIDVRLWLYFKVGYTGNSC
jgi:hypothetical protein